MIRSAPQKKDFFYVIDSGSESNQHMFRDVQTMEDGVQLSYIFSIKNPLLRLLNKVHLSTKINKIVDLPFKGIWDQFYIMDDKKKDTNVLKWVIVTNWSIRRFGLSYLKKIEKRSDYKVVLLFLDPLSAVPEFYLKYIREIRFDIIYSFDRDDCKLYNWIYTTNLYSKKDLPQNEHPENDIYYIGLDKGRAQFVEDIYSKLTNNGVRCDFVIISEDGKVFNNGNGLRYLNHRVSYNDVLLGVNNSRTIMEIVQNGQSGMTMRPYEAIFYNKRLLTNNRSIVDMDFYRPEYMKVFSSVDDIDISFIINQEKAEYNYQNQYSPVNWVRTIPLDYASRKNFNGVTI